MFDIAHFPFTTLNIKGYLHISFCLEVLYAVHDLAKDAALLFASNNYVANAIN